MRKILTLSLLCVLCTTAFADTDRSHVLKVYDWEDEYSPEVVEGFPAWYKAQTGEDIELMYQLLENDLAVLNQIELGHDDWDVLGTTSYYIKDILKRGLVQPIDHTLFEQTGTPDYLQDVSPYIQNNIRSANSYEGLDPNDYFIPISLCTLGLIYDTSLYSRDEVSSWTIMLDEKYRGKILMLNDELAVHYISQLCIHADELSRGELSYAELGNMIGEEDMKQTEEWFRRAAPNLMGYDTGFGYSYLVEGKIPIAACYSVDARFPIELSKEYGGPDFDFVVPREGTYLYSDVVCIPKYAGNPKAAAYWINYIMMPENVIKSLKNGYMTLTTESPEVLEAIQDKDKFPNPVDMSYLFPDTPTIATEVYVPSYRFQSTQDLEKTIVVPDIASRLMDFSKLLNRIQILPPTVRQFWPEILICLALVVFFIAKRISKKKQ